MVQWLMRSAVIGGLAASVFAAGELSRRGFGATPVGARVEKSIRDQSRTGPHFWSRGFHGGK